MIITPVVDDLFILAVVFETKLNLKIKIKKRHHLVTLKVIHYQSC